jgi:hypothetical protein
MSANAYHFITRWRVPSTLAEVAEILGNAPDLTRWWPSVYLDVNELEPGHPNGLGKVIDLYTKGWLPYTLRWQFRVTEARSDGFALEAWGDFVGRGNWIFEQDGAWVNITYEWAIAAEKPLLKALSPFVKPLFEFNHQWAMRMGEASLRLELARRHAATPEDRLLIPAPPGPTPAASHLALWLGGGALGLALWWVLSQRRRS